MGIEEELIERYKGLGKDFENRYVESDLRYFCAEFIVKTSLPYNFNLDKFRNLCKEEEKQGIGYLADVILTLDKDNILKQDTKKNIENTSKTFYDNYKRWIHIGTKSDLVKEWEELNIKHSSSLLNCKWKTYTSISPDDIIDWLDLYFEDYTNGRINVQALLLERKKFLRLSL